MNVFFRDLGFFLRSCDLLYFPHYWCTVNELSIFEFMSNIKCTELQTALDATKKSEISPSVSQTVLTAFTGTLELELCK